MNNAKANVSNYKDFDLDFSVNNLTDDIKVRSGYQSISQSVKNILFTYPGERPFSDVGGGILNFLFENDTPETLIALREQVTSLLKLYEPRISVEFNDITTERLSDGSLRINIKYKLAEDLGLNNTQNISLIVTGETNGQ